MEEEKVVYVTIICYLSSSEAHKQMIMHIIY